MSRLPVISGRECVRALESAGFYVRRQTGSHLILRRDDPFAQVVVPNHVTLNIKRHLDEVPLCDLARPAGLEPTTF